MCLQESGHGTRKLLKLSTNFKMFKLQNSLFPFTIHFVPSDTLEPYISSTFLPKKIIFVKLGIRRKKLLSRTEGKIKLGYSHVLEQNPAE
jgi:hypothetical protein